jgi:hypothetical protein
MAGLLSPAQLDTLAEVGREGTAAPGDVLRGLDVDLRAPRHRRGRR